MVKDIGMFDIADLAISADGKEIAVLRCKLGEGIVALVDSQNFAPKSNFSIDKDKNGKFRIDKWGKSVGMEWFAEENVLVVVEQHGAIRIWGTRSVGEKQGLIPKQENVKKRIPATSIEAQTVLDFGQIPYPQGSKMVYSTLEAFNCESPLDLKEAKLFFRYHFSRMGWLEHSAPNSDTIEFRKDDFMMTAKFESKATGTTRIRLSNGSNYDLRHAPRLKVGDLQVDFESASSVIYRTNVNLLTIECGLIRLMKEAGWVLFRNVTNGPDEPTDRFSKVKTPERLLTFLKNGVVLGIAIDQSPSEQVPSTIEYVKWLSEYSVPFPPGVNFVEFDFQNRCSFAAVAWMKSVDLKAFYDRELVQQGWTALPSQPSPYRDHYAQTYIRGQLCVRDRGRCFCHSGHKRDGLRSSVVRNDSCRRSATLITPVYQLTRISSVAFKCHCSAVNAKQLEPSRMARRVRYHVAPHTPLAHHML